ncbi:MAG: hypothetical protein KF715_19145 [Candidatus Didemnitutus sp.]|nr:hypothetical protein [Candidatus Didemnitutus sp.]
MLFCSRFAVWPALRRALCFVLPALSLFTAPVRAAGLSSEDDALLDDIERTAFRFFQEQAHPRTGLVRDRARADGSESMGKASIAASGFSLSAWVIATERGWVQRAAAAERVRAKLRFLANEAPRQKGFFYHFMEMDTGARAWKCELSSIDSALIYAGAIVAREYFADPEITALVNRLLGDVDWNWFLNEGSQVSLSWHDETGFSRYRWDRYSEHVLMSFLALGVSPRPLPAAYWRAWERKPIGRYGDFVYVQEPPLFVHQFPQGYLDLRERRDAAMDYFKNSQLATLAQRQFSIDLKKEFPSWGANLWGLTASDSATGYKAWGGPPRTLRFNSLDGTIVPCAAAGSLIFAPRETLAVLRHLRLAYGDRIWKRYGFVDAFNPETGWVNPDVIGIDQGISMIQAENLRSGLIHRLFMRAPEVQLGMAKAGLYSTRRELSQGEQDLVRAHAAAAWQQIQSGGADAGLQLTATLAAHRLGLLDGVEAVDRVRRLVAASMAPADYAGTSLLAAALITVRQGLPAVAVEATQKLAALSWPTKPTGEKLAAISRLGAFIGVGQGRDGATAWSGLDRTTQPRGAVHVLAPADPAGAVLPGLWLDERAVLSGASASQLAYATLDAHSAQLPDAMMLALLIDQFPGEVLHRFAGALGRASDDPANAQAALVIAAANLLSNDCVRAWFARDEIAQKARAGIPEFVEAAFGAKTSVVAQRELAGPRVLPEPRRAIAVSAAAPREQWQWHTVAGMEYKDSLADVRAGDPPVSLKFAFTWDAEALHFHAIVVDSPAGYLLPVERNRLVELFVDPAHDGLLWLGAGDYQFGFIRAHHWELKNTTDAVEFFHHAASSGKITPTADGYIVDGSIPWSALGVTPKPGLEMGVSPAVVAEGTKEWEPTIKLIWSYVREDESHVRLGVLTLQ